MLLHTPICDFGWQAVDFQLPDVDGARHSLTTLNGENGLLLAFICNHCPYVQAIIERLVDDAQQLQQAGIGVAAIMSNDYAAYPADAPEKMRLFAQRHQMNFPYLIDHDQSVAKAYDAICTPDFFGFNRELQLQYRGRILSDIQNPNSQPELLTAMLAVAKTGQGPTQQQASMGCSIKWRA